MKYLLAMLAGALFVGFLSSADPDLSDVYPVTPYDRCMAQYEGSTNVDQCEVLK